MFGAVMAALGWIGLALALLVALTYVSLIREVGLAYGSTINWRRNNVAYRYPSLRGVRWAVNTVEYLERIECAERGDFGHRIKQEADTLGGALIVSSVFMSISGVHYFIGQIVALF
ncbi:DNA primase [Stenotrophomonas phage StenM_174]|nr:DNA primase [Stenotrophomonas phage StenM_174]